MQLFSFKILYKTLTQQGSRCLLIEDLRKLIDL